MKVNGKIENRLVLLVALFSFVFTVQLAMNSDLWSGETGMFQYTDDGDKYQIKSSQSPLEWWNSSWQYRTKYQVNSTHALNDVPVFVEVNFTEVLDDLGIDFVSNPFIPESLRVVQIGDTAQQEIPYELVGLGNGNYSVEWCVNGSINTDVSRDFFLYFNNTGTWTKPNYYNINDYYDPEFIDADTWNKVVYYDANWGRRHWISAGTDVELKNYLNSKGFITKNATALKDWMDIKIANGAVGSVVVMARDSVPDTIAESQSTSNTMRRYMNAGGRMIWVADAHLYYQGHQGGSETRWGYGASSNILGVRANYYNNRRDLTMLPEGATWGHVIDDWPGGFSGSTRPVRQSDVTSTFSKISSQAAAVSWLKNYNTTFTSSGFIRLYPRTGFDGGDPDIQSDILNVSKAFLSPIENENITKVKSEQYFIDFVCRVEDLDGSDLVGANVSLYQVNSTGHYIYQNQSQIANSTSQVEFIELDPANYSFLVEWDLEGVDDVTGIIANTSSTYYNSDNDSILITCNITSLVINVQDLDGDPVEGVRVEYFYNTSIGTSLTNLTTNEAGNTTLRWFSENYTTHMYYSHENITGYELWDVGGELNLSNSDMEDIELAASITYQNINVNLSKFKIDVIAATSGEIIDGARVNFVNTSLGYNVNLTVTGGNQTFLWDANVTGINYNVSVYYLGTQKTFSINGSSLQTSHIISLNQLKYYTFNTSGEKKETFLDYNITVISHLDNSTTDFLNNNDTCVAYWNDVLNITVKYYYEDPTTSIDGATLGIDIKDVSEVVDSFSGFSYIPSLEFYNFELNTSLINATVGSQAYGRFYNLFFDAIKTGFQPNTTQFCTLNLLPYNTSLTRNVSSISLYWGYSVNISAYYNDTMHDTPITGASGSWWIERPGTDQEWGPFAITESPSDAGNYSLVFDSTTYELDIYTIRIRISKEKYLIQEKSISLSIIEVPTVLNGSKIFTYTTAGIVGEEWNFTLQYNRSDTGEYLDSAIIASYSWENQDTGNSGNGTLINLVGKGEYFFNFTGFEVGTYEITALIQRDRFEERQAFITILVGKSDFAYNVTPSSQTVVANDTAEFFLDVADAYNNTYLFDAGLVQFNDPGAIFANSVNIENLGNGTFFITVLPWNNTIKTGSFLLNFTINKSIYNTANFFVSLTVADWPISFEPGNPAYNVYKNEQLTIDLHLSDIWHGGDLDNAMVGANITGKTGATWVGTQYQQFTYIGSGDYQLVLNAVDTLASDAGEFRIRLNASIDISGLATYNFSNVASIDFTILRRPVFTGIDVNQTSIPFGNDVEFNLTISDGLNSSQVLESDALLISLSLGTLDYSFDSGNWTYTSGTFTMVVSTLSLPVGNYVALFQITMDAQIYLNSTASQNVQVIIHDVQAFISANQTSFPYGDDVEYTIYLEDLVDGARLIESNVQSIRVIVGSIDQTFTTVDWLYNSGQNEFVLNISTNTLVPGTYSTSIIITTDSSLFKNATLATTIWVQRHDVLANLLPIAPIPFGDDTTVDMELLDLVDDITVNEIDVDWIRINMDGTDYYFNSGNWTYNIGTISMDIPTSTLSIGSFTVQAFVALNPAKFFNSTDSLPITVRARLIEWVVLPSLGTPVGFDTTLEFKLIDLDSPTFSFIDTALVSWVNTTSDNIISWNLVDSETISVSLPTSDELLFPIGSIANFTLQVNGTGIDSSKTKNVSINIVSYDITADFKQIPSSVGWNQTSPTGYVFALSPDDFGKIWLSDQDSSVESNININITATWINGTGILIPASDISSTTGVSVSTASLGNYAIEVTAPELFNANGSADYIIQFNITAWYDRSGTNLPIFNNLVVNQSIEITKISSSTLLNPSNEEGGSGSQTIVNPPGENVTLYISYISGANVTLTIKDANDQEVTGYVDLSMNEVSSGLYTASLSGLPAGGYTVVITADPGANSNYEQATIDLSLTIETPFPWLFVIMAAAAAVVVALVAYKAISYYRIPKLVRVIDATISALRKEKNRDLNDIFKSQVEEEWTSLGLPVPDYVAKKDKPAPESNQPKTIGKKDVPKSYKEVGEQ